MPSTISALTALTYLYAAEPALPMGPRPTFIPRLLNGSARALLMIGSLAWRLILSNVQKVKRALLPLSALVRAILTACLRAQRRARTCTVLLVRSHACAHTDNQMDIGTPVASSSCTAARAQAAAHERFQRAFPGKHRSAHQAGLPVRPRQPCSAKADSIGVRRCVVAQGSFQEPLQRFRAVGHLCTDRAHVSVSPRSASIIISTGHIDSFYRF